MLSIPQTGGNGLLVPRYAALTARTNFIANPTNPLDDTLPHEYNRIVGQQTLAVTNLTTGFEWSVTLNGGTNAINNGYLGAFDASSNYGVFGSKHCAVTVVPPAIPVSLWVSTFIVDTDAPDSRRYILKYSPFTGVKPTIQLDPMSPPLGPQSVEVITYYIRNITL